MDYLTIAAVAGGDVDDNDYVDNDDVDNDGDNDYHGDTSAPSVHLGQA